MLTAVSFKIRIDKINSKRGHWVKTFAPSTVYTMCVRTDCGKKKKDGKNVATAGLKSYTSKITLKCPQIYCIEARLWMESKIKGYCPCNKKCVY